MAHKDSSAHSEEAAVSGDPWCHTQEQARDILAQWRAHTLSTKNDSSAGAEEVAAMAEVFKILGDATRLRILAALVRGGELCVGDLADQVEMSQSSVSHHLRILRHSRLLRAARRGREVYYKSDDRHVEMLLRVCLDHLQAR